MFALNLLTTFIKKQYLQRIVLRISEKKKKKKQIQEENYKQSYC